MKIRSALLAVALLTTAAPLGAFTLVEANPKVVVPRGDAFNVQVTLPEAVLCKGTHLLSPRTSYRVEIMSLGDGSVRARFFDPAGQNAGEANGIIAVLRKGVPPAAAEHAPGDASAMHKVQPGGSNAEGAMNFTKLGFGPNSPSKLSAEGQKRTLEIFSQDRAHGILIGLLLPAIQKVREAAAPPAQQAPGAPKIKN